MSVPANWISCPAPATTAREAPIRSAKSSQMASNPALCPPEPARRHVPPVVVSKSVRIVL